MSEAFQDARERLCAALKDEASTVGTTVRTCQFIMGGNLSRTDPEFSPVYADSLGRLWKECIGGGDETEPSAVCIYDPRSQIDPGAAKREMARLVRESANYRLV